MSFSWFIATVRSSESAAWRESFPELQSASSIAFRSVSRVPIALSKAGDAPCVATASTRRESSTPISSWRRRFVSIESVIAARVFSSSTPNFSIAYSTATGSKTAFWSPPSWASTASFRSRRLFAQVPRLKFRGHPHRG
jgi:hypothetical protein